LTVVATAGHVDHGKSTLVRALTGTDPDRFAEEKARGLTIDLGFATMTLPSGRPISFVDVPGHVRFLKNMLAGVGGVQACLFVVAATEGWKPQSEEHLRILELLGVDYGVVALTMAGQVDADDRALTRVDVTDRLAGSPLARAELIEVDSVEGTGLDDLRAALDRLVDTSPPAPDQGRARLWIDRSFAARGSGTIVTGTLAGGSLAVDDELVVLPRGALVRVRALQSHGRSLTSVGPGERVAVNLTGVGHRDVRRGDALAAPGHWHQTHTVDAELEVLAALDHPVSRRGAHVAYLGSGEHPVRLRVLGAEAVAPGGRGLVRLHLPVALPLLPGDRFVLRDSGRRQTIGGGQILDVDPVVRAARARPDRSVDRVVAERGWIDADELTRLTGVRREPSVGRWVVDPAALASVQDEVRGLVDAAGPLGLDLAALDDRRRAAVDGLGGLTVERGRVTAGPPDERRTDPLADHPFLRTAAETPFAPAPPDGVDRAELRELTRRGLIVEEGGIHFAALAIDQAAEVIAALLDEHPGGITVSQIREALGTSRKYAIPLVTLLDRTGRTRRRGDLRIAGPRLLRSATSRPETPSKPAGAPSMPSTPADRYRTLVEAFAAKVAAVQPDQWTNPSPCEGWTARDVVRHVVDTHAQFEGLVGRELGEVPSVDDDPVAALAAARAVVQADLDDPDRAGAAFEGFFGQSTFAAAVDRFVGFDLVVHGWDLARATGQDETIDPSEIDRVRAAAEAFGDSLRGSGVCAAAIDLGPEAGAQDRLLAFLGRQP
jgi:selenocysteine-specific elongation factor